MNKFLKFSSALYLVLQINNCFAQISFVGSAGLLPAEPDNCIQITPAAADTVGWVYATSRMDLSQDQDFEFQVFVGSMNTGGDGLVFLLHNDPRGASAIGCRGQGLGYGTNSVAICNGNTPISPSVGVEIDILSNTTGISFNDPANDHLAYVENGDLDHGTTNLNDIQNGRVFTTNIENGVRHQFRFVWTAATNNLKIYWDNVLSLNRTTDIPTIIGTNMASWGFTGSTGALSNQLYFCNSGGVTLSTALPIRLFRFDGQATANGTLLTWQTLLEENNDFFTIERADNSLDFETIGTVKGAGNSAQLTSYEFFDDNPLLGPNFYRLKQTDFDGNFTYSNVIFIDYQPEGEAQISIFPNPAYQEEGISLSVKGLQNQDLDVVITDVLGKTVYEGQFNTQFSQKFALKPQLLPGLYILSVTNSRKKLMQKFLIQ